MGKKRNKIPATFGGKKPLQVTRETQETTAFAGPIPHPQTLAEYDEISPGFANRIIAMAESEAEHRHKLQEKVVRSQIWEIRLGQIFALLIASFTMATGAYCALNGAQITGSLIGTSGVAGLVSVFISGRSKKEK